MTISTPDTRQTTHALQLAKLAKHLEDTCTIDAALRQDSQSFALVLIDAFSFSAKLQNNSRRKAQFYQLKSEAVALALALGCTAGIGRDGENKELLFLHTPGVGVVTVHTEFLGNTTVTAPWRHEWCALPRQPWSFAALEHAGIRQLLAQHTSPGAVGEERTFRKAALDIVPHYTYQNHI